MENPLVSVLILNYRSPQPTVECVFSLLEQSIADRMEIVVIDNHSEDDSIGVLRNRLSGIPNVHIVESARNGGFGRGCNLGSHHARGEFILVNNPDKRLQQDGVEKLVEKMQSDESIGILAPALLHEDGTRRLSARAYPRPLDVIAKRTFLQHLFPKRVSQYLLLDEDLSHEREVDWIVGGSFLMRQSLFQELGGFDDRFFLFFEDTDLCRRCKEQGKRVVYFPEVHANDRINRLSEGGMWKLISTRVGRAHIASGFRYFGKWRTRNAECRMQNAE